jgi:hypothetical protein
VAYGDGLKYPRLERALEQLDLLQEMIKPFKEEK